jgi:hypothetical protein
VPSAEALEILVAQSALETADWVKIYNWNFGNSKSTQQWPHTYFRTGERDPKTSRTVMYDPPHVNRDPTHVLQTRFRAFDTAAQGAEHHLRLLVGRYQAAYEHALAGRIVEFSRALYERGYYTGASADPVKWYTDALVRRAKSLDARAVAEVALESREYAIHLDEEIARRWPTKT